MAKSIVEFFGLPGSGKTFLSRRLVDAFRSNGMHVSDRSILLSHMSSTRRIILKVSLVLWWLPRNARLLREVVSLVLSCKPIRPRKTLKLLYNWLYIISLIKAELRSNDIVVLDQGIGQALWSTLFYGQKRPDSESMVGILESVLGSFGPISVHVIHVHASDNLIKRRLSERSNGRSPLDLDRDTVWPRAVATTNESRKILDKLFSVKSNIHMLEYSNDSSNIQVDSMEGLINALAIG